VKDSFDAGGSRSEAAGGVIFAKDQPEYAP